MGKSQLPGNYSLAKIRPESEAQARFCALANSALITSIFEALGPQAKLHLVGGTVRDIFSGLEPEDIDLACALPIQEAQQRLEQAGLYVVPTGLKHGTITIVIEKNNIELSSFRKPNSGELGLSIAEDLAGRDFTINAIAFDLINKKIIDPFAGAKHLESGVLTCVGAPSARFEEDALRILRMVRFGTAAGRKIDANTLKEARRLKSLLAQVSIERIRAELERILLAPEAKQGFLTLLELGILELILPEVIPAVGFEQNEFHVHDVFVHTLAVIENCRNDLVLRLSALFHDLGKAHTLSIDEQGRRHFYKHELVSEELQKQAMKRLRFSNEQIDAVARLVRMHMRPLDCGPSAVRRLMRDLGNQFDTWLELKRADATPVQDKKIFEQEFTNFMTLVNEEKERLHKLHYNKLAINGHDLMQLGVEEGVKMGQILKQLEEFVLEEPANNTRELLLREAKELIGRLG